MLAAKRTACRTQCRPWDAPSGACRPVPRSPRPPPLAPRTPRPVARLRSLASQLLWRGLTPRPRASSASARRLPDAAPSPHARPRSRSPGFRSRSLRRCQGLRPRRTRDALALTRTPVLPSAVTTASASRLILSRLNGWPIRTPADASPPASRPTTHGSGPMRFATPSS